MGEGAGGGGRCQIKWEEEGSPRGSDSERLRLDSLAELIEDGSWCVFFSRSAYPIF